MSDNIFAEIYNKILSLFGQNTKDESKNTAVNRLRLVLMQDRTNLTPEIMNRMRTELITVLSKYVELDKEALDINIGQEGEQMALMLSIPVIRAKDEEEIQQAIKEEDEAKKAEAESEDKENISEEKEIEESVENAEETEGTEEANEDDSINIKNNNSEEPTTKPEETQIDESVQKSIPKIEKNTKNKEEDSSEE